MYWSLSVCVPDGGYLLCLLLVWGAWAQPRPVLEQAVAEGRALTTGPDGEPRLYVLERFSLSLCMYVCMYAFVCVSMYIHVCVHMFPSLIYVFVCPSLCVCVHERDVDIIFLGLVAVCRTCC